MTALTLSTHILNTAAGVPVEGVPVTLARLEPNGTWADVASGVTDADGRIADLGAASAELAAGRYRVHFDLEGAWAVEHSWYPEVSIVVDLAGDPGHTHVPLLLAPYGYTTYRGS